MIPRDATIALAILKDPARRRRLVRRAGIEAARLRLRGPFEYHIDGTALVAEVDGTEVARMDAFDAAAEC